jgi:hypothetical protein
LSSFNSDYFSYVSGYFGTSIAYTKPEKALVVQLQSGKNSFNTFSYQARIPSFISLYCSYGMSYQIAKNIIHCHKYSALRHAYRDNPGHTPTKQETASHNLISLQRVTRLVIERGMLSLYQRAQISLLFQAE